MKNSIDISEEDKNLLYRYIGQGSPDSKLIIFGNEPGLAGSSVNKTIECVKNLAHEPAWRVSDEPTSEFMIKESYINPTTSEFARFSARLKLAIDYKDSRWVKELSKSGIAAINQHICTPINEKSMALINLRPLPRHTQDDWVYSNVGRKDYLREWNFLLKRPVNRSLQTLKRQQALKEFILSSDRHVSSLIIGVGEKENKKAFIEKMIGEKSSFIKVDLESHSIYYNSELKIILSGYFNNRNGIKLKGLQELFCFINP